VPELEEESDGRVQCRTARGKLLLHAVGSGDEKDDIGAVLGEAWMGHRF